MCVAGYEWKANIMMKYQDYYKTLGVPRDASEREIKQAYRQLARECHPDLHPGDEAASSRFKQINEAYEVLSDSEKRARYDRLGASYHQWQQQGQKATHFDWSRWAQSNGGSARRGRSSVDYDANLGGIFSEFFSSIFGDNNRSSRSYKPPIRGKNIEMEVTISLEEAYQGTTHKVVHNNKKFTARIPRGAYDGTKIRYANHGNRGFSGGESGDLFIVVKVAEHPVFERDGNDLFMDLKVPLYTAVLGGTMRVPTLAGDVRLKIAPGTQSGQRIRLKDKGMPHLRSDEVFGDLFVRVLVQVPTDLSEEEEDLFWQLSLLRPDD